MSLENAAVARTFLNLAQADLAAAQLRSSGIECLIRSDDAGGMYPPLETIKLLVSPEDLEAARRILTDTFEAAPASVFERTPDTVPKPVLPPPPFAKFGWGLLVGILGGVLLHLGYEKAQSLVERTYRYDNDRDGITDEFHVWKMGQTVESRYDRNGDRWTDFRSHYLNGIIANDEADDNLDGATDAWYTYGPRRFFLSARFDTDFNGIVDARATYRDGIMLQTDWQPNGTNHVLVRQVFEHGILKEELRDLDGDGRFDVSVRFGPFVNPIQTNFLVLVSGPR